MSKQRHRRALPLLLLALCLPACKSGQQAQKSAAAPPPPLMFDGMGAHHRAVTTSSPEAQRWFDQGLVWMYGFNHDEAIRSFREAARIDPSCAMAWWGVAICNGPHINLPVMDAERDAAAWEALQKAMALRDSATPTERALIEALSKRYANPAPEDRAALDRAYADAMRAVWRDHPDDADVGTLCAESIMDLHPWDLWTIDGQPKEGAEEIVTTLEATLRLNPRHPGANHLYIHAVEASYDPGRAMPSADFLRDAVPASGHLTHMPSHIYVRTGKWAEASIANERAIKADEAYRRLSPRQGFYMLYMAHDPHFLSFASMMQGRSDDAMAAARRMLDDVPTDYVKENAAFSDPYMGIDLSVMMRFGQWEEILRQPAPPKYLAFTRAMWRFTRAVAYASLGRVNEAEKERELFRSAVAAVPDDRLLAINPAHKVLAIAASVLDGEIAYRKGEMAQAVASLREAVALEDTLLYMEPPEWIQPVRHTLGAVLFADGQYSEAEEVYRQDLARWRENGWSLYGLARCLEAQGDAAEARAVRARFDKAWENADVSIESTCLCVAPAVKKKR